jgi:beta-glucanase (GH16 family)
MVESVENERNKCFSRIILGSILALLLLSGCAFGELWQGVSDSLDEPRVQSIQSNSLTTKAETATPEPQPTQPDPTPSPTPTPVLKPSGQGGDWQVIFHDEFEGQQLDTNHWNTCHWWDDEGCTIKSNHELEWYQPGNVVVDGGILSLVAREEEILASNGLVFPYTSGMVSSGPKRYERSEPALFSFQYGWAEIKAKIPAGVGFWPAFWMLPVNRESTPEIDVMELLGNDPTELITYYHYDAANGKEIRFGEKRQGPDYSQDWHTFAIDWQPDHLVWYVDGVEVQRFTEAENIPHIPMYIVLNFAVGGDWPGTPAEDTLFPSMFEIDYVRVFRSSNLE